MVCRYRTLKMSQLWTEDWWMAETKILSTCNALTWLNYNAIFPTAPVTSLSLPTALERLPDAVYPRTTFRGRCVRASGVRLVKCTNSCKAGVPQRTAAVVGVPTETSHVRRIARIVCHYQRAHEVRYRLWGVTQVSSRSLGQYLLSMQRMRKRTPHTPVRSCQACNCFPTLTFIQGIQSQHHFRI
ncbi:hypothetical protein BC629DRAFT_904009 [Irpex lacteus]|nr:hypothetical protein BC629DRAFT_904009 [Irpex lacteus]